MDNYLFSKGSYYSLSGFQMFMTERERTAVFVLQTKISIYLLLPGVRMKCTTSHKFKTKMKNWDCFFRLYKTDI